MGLEKSLGDVLHIYQPGRQNPIEDGKRMDMVAWINEMIYQQVYRPLLVEGDNLPLGTAFSFYAPLREWMRSYHSDSFKRVVEKIRKLPGREYLVLGDPLIHLILPFGDSVDQEILIRAGRRAFAEDLGFLPHGFWPPETAVSTPVLEMLAKNDYRFLALREEQMTGGSGEVVWIPLPSGRKMKVIVCNSKWSGSMAFQDSVTENGDNFLEWIKQEIAGAMVLEMDGETFGHHKPLRDMFYKYVFTEEVMKRHGLVPFDFVQELTKTSLSQQAIIENSSWSCDHRLGRWNGTCDCDSPSAEARQDKMHFYGRLMFLKSVIKGQLDKVHPGWKEEFIDLLVKDRHYIFGISDRNEVCSINRSIEIKKLYQALIDVYLGLTSCGWFFGKTDSPERALPATMIAEVEKLLA